MKKVFFLCLLVFYLITNAQTSANRFFYQLVFKPKKDSTRIEKVMTILDILSKKSIYQDYTIRSQDSAIIAQIEKLQRSNMWNAPKGLKTPKFTYKVIKSYPDMNITYTDRISRNLFGYVSNDKFQWNILPDRKKIGEYNTQKATCNFSGRHWIAWFTNEVPFQDGPYKFYGLPGLIVKIEDSDKNYSWELKGNKKVEKYDELSEVEKFSAKVGMKNSVVITTKEKFNKVYKVYKEDPMAEVRPLITSKMLKSKMPGSDVTVGEILKQQEKNAKEFLNSNNNPIEISSDN